MQAQISNSNARVEMVTLSARAVAILLYRLERTFNEQNAKIIAMVRLICCLVSWHTFALENLQVEEQANVTRMDNDWMREELEDIRVELRKKIKKLRRKMMTDCRQSPCKNSGTCIDQFDDYICLCMPGWKVRGVKKRTLVEKERLAGKELRRSDKTMRFNPRDEFGLH